jgi:hypothetical protein
MVSPAHRGYWFILQTVVIQLQGFFVSRPGRQLFATYVVENIGEIKPFPLYLISISGVEV